MKPLLKLIFLTCLGFTANAQAPGGQYVGSTTCKACHPDVWLKFYKNPHFKSVASGKEEPANTGCEGCHGPGGAHVQAHGGKATIVAFSELSPKQTISACLRCHAKTLERANIHASNHTLSDVGCAQCHSIHKSPTPKYLLAKAQPELCYGCHTNLRAEFSMPFKHRVNEGFMKCSDCHNPHGTFAPTWRMASRPSLVSQAPANEESCLKCHADKRGPSLLIIRRCGLKAASLVIIHTDPRIHVCYGAQSSLRCASSVITARARSVEPFPGYRACRRHITWLIRAIKTARIVMSAFMARMQIHSFFGNPHAYEVTPDVVAACRGVLPCAAARCADS